VKAAVLIFAVVGVAPAIILSAFLLYMGFFTVPSYQPPNVHAKPASLTKRVYLVQILQGQKSTLSFVMWLPLVVLMLGIAFFVALFFLLYGH
jgi:hypothetical protein